MSNLRRGLLAILVAKRWADSGSPTAKLLARVLLEQFTPEGVVTQELLEELGEVLEKIDDERRPEVGRRR